MVYLVRIHIELRSIALMVDVAVHVGSESSHLMLQSVVDYPGQSKFEMDRTCQGLIGSYCCKSLDDRYMVCEAVVTGSLNVEIVEQ